MSAIAGTPHLEPRRPDEPVKPSALAAARGAGVVVAGHDLVIFPGIATHLTEVSPPYALVIEGWGAYVIEPVDDSRCRLIARSSAEPDAAGLLTVLLIELPHAIMERRMLLGIKERAERRHRAAGRAGAAS